MQWTERKYLLSRNVIFCYSHMVMHIHYKGRQEALSMSETVRTQGDKPYGTTDTRAQQAEQKQK